MNTVNAAAEPEPIKFQPWLNAAAAPPVGWSIAYDTTGAMTFVPLTTISVASGWPPVGSAYHNFTTGR